MIKNAVVVLIVLGALSSAPLSFGQTTGSEPEKKFVQGTVQSVDWAGSKIVVSVYGESGAAEDIPFIVSDDAVLTRGSDELSLSDIDQGDQVEIQYVRTSEGPKIVRLNDTNMANAF